MLSMEQVHGVIGGNAYASDGDKLGRIGQVFLDDETGEPEFVTVNTGLFGTSESFVPIAEASQTGDGLTVPYTKDHVKDAPHVDVAGGHLSRDEEERIYVHYGLGHSERHSDSGLPTGSETGMTDGPTGTVGHDTSGPTTDQAMTRSEEQVRVGTRDQEAGRVRLRKWVETEEVTETIPVRKEKAVIEREPITEANVGAATEGPAISDEEHEVVLHEERPVVEKEVTPVERVRLDKATEVEAQQVSEEVRKEQIAVDGDVDDRRS
jgi:uncharacterized protein (TIGR02271 family)